MKKMTMEEFFIPILSFWNKNKKLALGPAFYFMLIDQAHFAVDLIVVVQP